MTSPPSMESGQQDRSRDSLEILDELHASFQRITHELGVQHAFKADAMLQPIQKACSLLVDLAYLAVVVRRQLTDVIRTSPSGTRSMPIEKSSEAPSAEGPARRTSHENLSLPMAMAREQTLDLLDQLRSLTGDLRAVKGLLREAEHDKQRSLDTVSAPRQEQILNNEIQKVERVEAVLSVIGTVKAGKSTLINSIVGMELLPNRKLPMTTYPTYIRHDEARIKPALHVPMAADFTRLIEQVRVTLASRSQDWRTGDELLDHLAARISSRDLTSLATEHEGRQQVVAALEIINDLTRLSALLDLSVPTPPNGTTDSFPSISVRFSNMKAMSIAGSGRLSLLDTPGPNEREIGDALRSIVRQKIEETSAVILVADLTQLQVEASDDVQKLLREGLFDVLDRVYVLVNKFDQASAKDWSFDATRTHVARMLVDGKIPPERIFPVSALEGFLANAVHRWLELHDSLPDEWWAEDFLNKMGGVYAAVLKNDTVQARTAALAAWEKSRLNQPLDQVIAHAARNAARLCIEAALDKVIHHGRRTSTYLGLRETAATMDAEKLKKEMDELDSDISDVDHARARAQTLVDEQFEQAVKDLDAVATEIDAELLDVFDAIFSSTSTMRVSREAMEAAQEALRKKRKGAPWHHMFGERPVEIDKRTGRGEEDALPKLVSINNDEDSPLMRELKEMAVLNPAHVQLGVTFDREEDAQKMIEKVRESVNRVLQSADAALTCMIGQRLNSLGDQIEDSVAKDLGPILRKARDRMRREFDVAIDLPGLNLRSEATEFFERDTSAAVTRRTVNDEKYVERDTRTAAAKRWTGRMLGKIGIDQGKHWGYDKIRISRSVHGLDVAQIKKGVTSTMATFRARTTDQLKHFVHASVKASVGDYFNRTAAYLSGFKTDLADALADKNLKQQDLEALYVEILKLKARCQVALEGGILSVDVLKKIPPD